MRPLAGASGAALYGRLRATRRMAALQGHRPLHASGGAAFRRGQIGVGPLLGGAMRGSERPDSCPEKGERRDQHDGSRLRGEPIRAGPDKHPEDEEVRHERSKRHREEARALRRDASPVVAKGPKAVQDEVVGNGDKERRRRGAEVMGSVVEQRRVDRKVDSVADGADRTELAELMPVPASTEGSSGAAYYVNIH
jgi:hypothetical protein